MHLPFEFSLAACSSLRTLCLRCPIALHSTVPWVNALLADVNPAQLARLSIEVRLLGSMHALDWARMQELILQDSFQSLETVSIKVAVWHTSTERKHNIRPFFNTHLSKLQSKGLLQFIE